MFLYAEFHNTRVRHVAFKISNNSASLTGPLHYLGNVGRPHYGIQAALITTAITSSVCPISRENGFGKLKSCPQQKPFAKWRKEVNWIIMTEKSFLSFKDVRLLLLLSRFSCVRLCVTPETAAHQALPSLEFSRQEHWSGLPFPSPMQESEK